MFVRPGTVRRADATEPGTTVLIVGVTPGEAYVPQEQEVWMPLYEQGRYDEAVAVLESVLAKHPDARVLYNLACMESLAGRGDDALEHIRRAVELRPALAEQARADDDFAPIRDDARFESAVAGQADAGGAGA